MIVGTIETLATNQIWSISSRQAKGGRRIAANVSAVRTKKSPTARIGLATTPVLTRASTGDSCPARNYRSRT